MSSEEFGRLACLRYVRRISVELLYFLSYSEYFKNLLVICISLVKIIYKHISKE
jgi:hypothetical protein